MLKAADNTPYEKIGDEVRSLADEVPFDIPDSWEWVRLSQIALVLNGDRGKNYPSKEKLVSSGIPFISALNLDGRTVVKDGNLLCVTEEQYNLLANGKLIEGDIVVCIRGSLGKHAKYPFEKGAIASSLVILRTLSNEETLADYIMMWLDSPLFFSEIRKYDNGTAQPNLAAKSLEQFFVPIPPLGEQRRIVEKINEVTSAVSAYDVAYQRNETLNSAFPESLKKSILQEAVQGKLVPQDPSDEPAEALLERIRAEKQRLIKEGKIKKDKHESVIFRRDNSHYEKRGSEEVCIDEEIPFEIPENWAWCRASSLGTMIRGRGIKRTETVAQGCPCIRYGEIYTTYETSFDSAVSFVPETLDKDCLHFSSGDVVFTLTGENKVDIAKTVAFLGEGQIAAGGDLAFWTHHGMNPLYLVYYMASPYCIELKRRTATGDIIVHISTSKVGDFLVPIPPIKEQNRIVSAIEQLFAVASTL